MHDTTITIRVSADLKRRAAKAAEGYGTSLSQAIRLFLDAFAEQSEPSEPRTYRSLAPLQPGKDVEDIFQYPVMPPIIIYHPARDEEGDIDIIDPVVRG